MTTALPPPEAVEFPSAGALLRGRFYPRAGSGEGPAVLMAHGFSATCTGMVADQYAEVLQAAGLGVLLFDHLSFGVSGGTPRQVLNHWTQMLGYRDALDFIVGIASVDASRLAVWGDSMSGSVALGVCAFDDRVRALVVQVPACGSGLPPEDPDGAAFRTLRDIYRDGGPISAPKQRIGPMAVVSADQLANPSLLSPITAYRWFTDYGGRPGTGWLNQATLEVPDTPITFHSVLCAPRLNAASLWVIAEEDEMPGAEPAIANRAYDLAPEPKQRMAISGGHFGLLYHPSTLFDAVSTAQAQFLVRWLNP